MRVIEPGVPENTCYPAEIGLCRKTEELRSVWSAEKRRERDGAKTACPEVRVLNQSLYREKELALKQINKSKLEAAAATGHVRLFVGAPSLVLVFGI